MEHLNLKCRGIKASTIKLLAKVEDMLSTDLENISIQSVSEAKKLLAETTLTQLKAKRQQIVEPIADKIEGDEEFEEEIINADAYQMTLEERLAFLTEFIRKAGLPPPDSQHPPLISVPPQISSSPSQQLARTTQPYHQRHLHM